MREASRHSGVTVIHCITKRKGTRAKHHDTVPDALRSQQARWLLEWPYVLQQRTYSVVTLLHKSGHAARNAAVVLAGPRLRGVQEARGSQCCFIAPGNTTATNTRIHINTTTVRVATTHTGSCIKTRPYSMGGKQSHCRLVPSTSPLPASVTAYIRAARSACSHRHRGDAAQLSLRGCVHSLQPSAAPPRAPGPLGKAIGGEHQHR